MEKGYAIDVDKTPAALGLTDAQRLFLTLRVGWGGGKPAPVQPSCETCEHHGGQGTDGPCIDCATAESDYSNYQPREQERTCGTCGRARVHGFCFMAGCNDTSHRNWTPRQPPARSRVGWVDGVLFDNKPGPFGFGLWTEGPSASNQVRVRVTEEVES